jgi:hypothetical protein
MQQIDIKRKYFHFFSFSLKQNSKFAPYMVMKNIILFFAALLCSATLFASDPFCEWSLVWSGLWEKTSFINSLNRTFHNQGEIEVNMLPVGLLLRSRILDRRTINLGIENFHVNPVREITNFTGGLYHTSTNSRLLAGVLDEWGLPARIRNPWIRSPPYAENRRAAIAELRTEASSTREDELYLYLSSPLLEIFPNVNIRCFASAQTTMFNNDSIAFSGGMNIIHNRTSLLLETFYTEKTLTPVIPSTWFVNQPESLPALPEREFKLYAASFLFRNPAFSGSSDFALSETFAWGTDIYANFGLSFSPVLPFGTRARPLLISLAADGAGARFVYRDGGSYGEGFRTAAKIEWRSRYNSLLRLDAVLRSPGIGQEINRTSIGFFYRSPTVTRNNNTLRITRISLNYNDNISATLGLNINMQKIGLSNPLRINLSGFTDRDSASGSCEFIWSNKNFQIRSKTGYTNYLEKDDKWSFSVSTLIRFRQGRLSLRAESPDFPEKWNWSMSWRIEINGK